MKSLKFGINSHLDYVLKCDIPHKFVIKLSNKKYFVGETDEYPIKINHNTKNYDWITNNLPAKLIEFYPCTKSINDYVHTWISVVGKNNVRSNLKENTETCWII